MTHIIVLLTLEALGVSMTLVTLSSWMVSVKAGQGEEWAYLDLLENSGFAHWEQTYIPADNQTKDQKIYDLKILSKITLQKKVLSVYFWFNSFANTNTEDFYTYS